MSDQVWPNSALSPDAFNSLRCAYGAAKRGRQATWMRALEAIAVAMLMASAHAQNPDPDVLWKEVSAKPGSRVVQERNLTRVEVSSERAQYYFTQPGHFAHPSVVIRKVEVKNGTIDVTTQGFTTGDKAVFNRWLAAFLEQDAQRSRAFEKAFEKKSRSQ